MNSEVTILFRLNFFCVISFVTLQFANKIALPENKQEYLDSKDFIDIVGNINVRCNK